MTIEIPSEEELDARELRVVAPPDDPQTNARLFLAANYSGTTDRRLLLTYGGDPLVWNGSCWTAMEIATLLAQIYDWFGRRCIRARSRTTSSASSRTRPRSLRSRTAAG